MLRGTSTFLDYFLHPPLQFYSDLLVIIASLLELGHIDMVGMNCLGRVTIDSS
jgi:hypothetical protein